MGTILFRFLAGGIAGLLGWLIIEPTAPPYGGLPWQMFELRLDMVCGSLIAMTLGAAIGWQRGSRTHTLRGALIGLVVGGVACVIGAGIGSIFARSFFGQNAFEPETAVPLRMIARSFVGVGLGSILGIAVGAAGGGGKRILLGFIGGAIGGFASGFLFDPLSTLLAPITAGLRQETGPVVEVGQAGRMVLFLTIGALVGAFTGLVEMVAKTAWVRQVFGRNEFKEWPIFSSPFTIGRRENADVPLFGDPNVLPTHAVIVREGNAYWLQQAGPSPVFLNGQPVQRAPLGSQATIQVGGVALQFMLKAGSAPARAAEALRGQPLTPSPQVGRGQGVGNQPGPPMAPQLGSPPPHGGSVQGVGNAAMQPPAGLVNPVPTLVVMNGPTAGQRFPITGPTEIGRECPGIPLPHDLRASRRHASLAADLTLTDLGSTNGTTVNGVKITSQMIRPGDMIQIGDTTFRVE